MKKSFVFIIFILFGLNFFGQGEVNVFQQDSIIADTIKITTKIEGSVFGGGGLSTYLYNPKVGSTNLGLGVIAGFEATFWRDNIGFTTGLHYNSYTSKYSIDNTTLYTPSRDYDTYDAKPREDFNLRTEYSGYSEQITSHYFGIPFMLSYKKVFDNNVRLNTGGGFKLSYLMSSKSVNKGNFSAFGDYSQARGVNASRITDGPGFETYSGEDFEVENNFGIGASGIATFDVGYAFSDDFILFGGPYLEYQFFGAGTDDKYLNNYVASDMLTATVDYQGVSNSNLVDNMNRFALGFKVGVTFTLRGKRYIVKEIKYRAIVVEKEIEDPDKNLKQAQSWYEMSDSLKRSIHQLVLENTPIHFELSGYSLDDVSEQRIKNIAEVLFDYPELKITLVGHTCDIGSEDANYILGLSRAHNVYELLIEEGVLPGNLIIKSRGELEPAHPNDTEKNRALNRRVEFKIVE